MVSQKPKCKNNAETQAQRNGLLATDLQDRSANPPITRAITRVTGSQGGPEKTERHTSHNMWMQ